VRRAIGPGGFEARFAADPDPWATRTARDEAVKREAVLRALGPGRRGRVLELGCGNGSTTRALAGRALALRAVDASPSAVALAGAATAGEGAVRVERRLLPGPLPGGPFDAVVIAELLYYLASPAAARLARAVAAALAPGGALVLAHHRVPFHDVSQPPEGVHDRFLAASGARWRRVPGRRTARWRVERAVPAGAGRAQDAES
jgi:SAM-dependent methyltransferase